MNGDSIDVYNPNGQFMETRYDGKSAITGLFYQTEESCEDGSCNYTDGLSFSYNDVGLDREGLQSGESTLRLVSNSTIEDVVSTGVSEVDGLWSAGRKNGALDYWAKDPNIAPANIVNLVTNKAGKTTALNSHDYGNFLTGQSYRRLNMPLPLVSLGAHLNNFLNGGDYGGGVIFGRRGPYLGSAADQIAIRKGYNHFAQPSNVIIPPIRRY